MGPPSGCASCCPGDGTLTRALEPSTAMVAQHTTMHVITSASPESLADGTPSAIARALRAALDAEAIAGVVDLLSRKTVDA